MHCEILTQLLHHRLFVVMEGLGFSTVGQEECETCERPAPVGLLGLLSFGKVPAELQSFSAHVVQRVRSMCVLASVTGAVAAICDVLYACCVEHA